jgi:transcriptional regulator with XRE-family HTH domain
MKFGQWLKNERIKRAMSKEELGHFAGITASTIGQIESGSIKRPPQKRLQGFAAAFGMDVGEVEAALNSEVDEVKAA